MAAPAEVIAQLTQTVTYDRLRPPLRLVDAKAELDARRRGGGSLVRASQSELRWYPADVEDAMRQADRGDIRRAALLWRATWSDGIVSGVLSTRTGGLVRLPRRFTGAPKVQDALRGNAEVRGDFTRLCPLNELALMKADDIGVGVHVGELLPVEDRAFPILARLPPEFLRFDRQQNRWYYMSTAGPLLVEPGDGRWVLGTPGGRVNPWQSGQWQSVGTSWIDKLHARDHDANWQSKLANPARVATSPLGATEYAREGWVDTVLAWGVNTVIETPPGYEIDLLESNGVGHEAFNDTIKRSDRENIVALAGQEVTVDGGTGFSNRDVHLAIRADLIQADADTLSETLNTQVLPWYSWHAHGERNNPGQVNWDTTSPQQRTDQAKSWSAFGDALDKTNKALERYGRRVSIAVPLNVFAIETEEIPTQTTRIKLTLAPTDVAKVVRVDEARSSQGLEPIGDDRGELTLAELEASLQAMGSDVGAPANDVTEPEQTKDDDGDQTTT